MLSIPRLSTGRNFVVPLDKDVRRFLDRLLNTLGRFKMTTLLRLPAVVQRTGLSRAKIYVLLGENKFPRPVKLGERVNVWPDNEIEDWITARIAERPVGASAHVA